MTAESECKISYDSLIEDLSQAPRWKELGINKRAKKESDAPGGLNIEALAGNNGALLIGFRNPLPDNKALVVHVTDLDEIAKGKNQNLVYPSS